MQEKMILLKKKNVYNTKIKNTENKISGITNLATTAALTGIENEIFNVSNLVKKTDYNTKIIEIKNKITASYDHDKHVTTQEFDKLTSENFTAKLKQVNLASKNDIAKFVKKSLGNKLKSFRSNKIELNELSKKVKAISTKGLKKI